MIKGYQGLLLLVSLAGLLLGLHLSTDYAGTNRQSAARPATRTSFQATAPLESFTDADFTRHVEQLKKKLPSNEFSIVIQPPFVVIGDQAATVVKAHSESTVKWAVDKLKQDFFAKDPKEILDIWLFKDSVSYEKNALALFGEKPTTPYGYYSSTDNALVMNIGPGAGTLSHELVHPYIEANFPDAPSWFNEGLASLYEQPREREGHMWGTTNWRLPGLTSMIRKKDIPTLRTLLTTTNDEFYNAEFDAYAYARFLCQYLQDHGKLRDFYKDFVASKDHTGVTSLEKAVGKSLEEFQPEFNKWALSLRR